MLYTIFIVPEWVPPSAMMTSSGVSFTNIQEPKSHQKFLREKKTNGSGQQPQPASLNPNRASYPGPAASTTMTSTDLSSAMSSSSTSSSGERLNGTDGKKMLRIFFLKFTDNYISFFPPKYFR